MILMLVNGDAVFDYSVIIAWFEEFYGLILDLLRVIWNFDEALNTDFLFKLGAKMYYSSW